MPCRSCRGRGSLVRAIRQHGEGSSEPLRFFPFVALRVRQSSRLQSAVMATNLIPYGDGCPRAESPSRTGRATSKRVHHRRRRSGNSSVDQPLDRVLANDSYLCVNRDPVFASHSPPRPCTIKRVTPPFATYHA